jgi:hypothetical protein
MLIHSFSRVGNVQDYRLYVLEAGFLLWPHEFCAPDDASAIEFAVQRWIEGCQMELWERNRKVGSWGFPETG